MSETALSGIFAALAAVGGWMVYDALRSGESINAYGVDSSRNCNPVLFWFDMAVMGIATLAGAVMAILLFLQGI